MTTEAAREWLNVQVRGHVIPKGRVISEGSVTLVTGIWPLISVRAHVSLEVNLPCKRPIAHVASIGSFSRMREDMVFKMGREHRRVGAIRTAMQDHEPMDLHACTTDDDIFSTHL